jgi:glucose-6-phosphate dehydrogenase assembly protein OpcA
MTAPIKTREHEAQSRTEQFLSGKLAQVDIKRIESELRHLWESAGRSDRDMPQGPITRACVMNLILFSDHQEAEKDAGDFLADIILRHPCRAILAINRAGKERNLEAWVSARCHKTDEKTNKQICCEQITVRGQSVSAKELASAVLPMIVPDLPVFVWWQAANLEHKLVQPFVSATDRFIVDSANNPNSLVFFSELQKVMSETHPGTKQPAVLCTDLNWRRSLPWRESVALAFEERHGHLPSEYVHGITSVELRYGQGSNQNKAGSPGLTNQALLVVGWLAAQLKWCLQKADLADRGTIELAFDNKGLKVSVKLIGVAADEAMEGDIGSIQIRTTKPQPATVVASQHPGLPGIGVTCQQGTDRPKADASAATFELDEAPESQLIDKELADLGGEPVFTGAVRATVEILNLLGTCAAKQ